MRADGSRVGPRPPRGFTLVEGLISLLIMSMVMIGLLTLMDSANKLAKQETQVADAQSGSRAGVGEITRILRQARTGQVSPVFAVIPLVNNATTSTPALVDVNGTSHTVRPGTDAIEVRGVLYGDEYYFGPADVTCSGLPCTGLLSASTTVVVTIRQQFPTGQIDPITLKQVNWVNYAARTKPDFASRTRPFYFGVSSTLYQNADPADPTSGLAGQYVVGQVDVPAGGGSGSWYTFNAGDTNGENGSFSFTMTVDPTSTTLRALMGRAQGSTAVPGPQKPLAGGVVDDVVFFVDEGPQNPREGSRRTQPFLAQAVLTGSAVSATSGAWDVQPLVENVEDLQFAFGIDGAKTASAPDWSSSWGAEPASGTRDGGVDPVQQSTATDADEWVLNASGEGATDGAANHLPQNSAPYTQFLQAGVVAPSFAAMSLRAILVGVVAKSNDPDVTFSGPGAKGVRLFDSTAQPVVTDRAYRRRTMTMAVNLRNYQ